MQIGIESEKDRVILVFPGRGCDLGLSPDTARKFVDGVRRAAKYCSEWVEAGGSCQLVRGESRGALVRSWDGKVYVRFDSITDRESIPYRDALRLADEVERRITEAELHVTILLHSKRGF